MRLLEFQAKRILAEYGIPVPTSRLIQSPSDLAGIEIPTVLKAQVPTGRRGRAGGIRIVAAEKEARAVALELLSSNIRGHRVRSLLAEEKADVNREIYLALLLDKRANLPMVMASASGGVDIELLARQHPEQIVQKHIHPLVGLQQHNIRYLARALNIDELVTFGQILQQMYAILWERDATLVEINPLAETATGLVALDAKIVLDDKATFRNADWFASLRAGQKALETATKTRAERLAQERGITYVLLDGDLGLISDGAGTGMLCLDLIQDAGGRAADFCEVGGLASADVMCQSIEVALANPKVGVLLISLIGGLTRMDEMAEGVVRYLKQHETSVPMVIRMCGTREAVGKATLQEVGIGTFDDLAEAVQRAVELARVA